MRRQKAIKEIASYLNSNGPAGLREILQHMSEFQHGLTRRELGRILRRSEMFAPNHLDNWAVVE